MRDMKAIGDAIVDTVREYVSRSVTEITARLDFLDVRIAEIPAGKDGADGLHGKDGAPGEPGAAGRDGADGAPGADGANGIDGKDGAPGRDGIDGKSITLDDVRPMLDAALARLELDVERRVTETIQRAIDRIPLPRDGRDGIDGKDGRDALELEDLEVEHDADGLLTFRLVRGELRKEYAFQLLMLKDCGTYQADGSYQRGNGVSFGGSFWIAQKNDPGKPGEGEGWRLAVKRGRDGRDGERGEKGEPGKVLKAA
jgi:integrin beta 3